jgi:RNA polymerase sigma factor (sigma-70 family)
VDREDEFLDLFAEECVPVTRTVFLIVHDQERAEEITQDAFVQLLRHWKRVSTYDRPGAWVRSVAIRLAVRQVGRERAIASAAAMWRPSATPDPSEPVSGRLLEALQELSPKQRAAIVLFYFEDRPTDEIGELLGCSTSTAGVHLHRGRRHLEQLLSREAASDAQ